MGETDGCSKQWRTGARTGAGARWGKRRDRRDRQDPPRRDRQEREALRPARAAHEGPLHVLPARDEGLLVLVGYAEVDLDDLGDPFFFPSGLQLLSEPRYAIVLSSHPFPPWVR